MSTVPFPSPASAAGNGPSRFSSTADRAHWLRAAVKRIRVRAHGPANDNASMTLRRQFHTYALDGRSCLTIKHVHGRQLQQKHQRFYLSPSFPSPALPDIGQDVYRGKHRRTFSPVPRFR